MMLSLTEFSNHVLLFSGTVAKESTWVWMSSVLMEQRCTLPSAASSPDPFDSFIMETPSMMESKSRDQASHDSRCVLRLLFIHFIYLSKVSVALQFKQRVN